MKEHNNLSKAQISLIFDETNVSETNHFKSLFEILLKLAMILVSVYLFIYFSIGLIINDLSIENQIKLENFIASTVDEPSNVATEEEQKKLEEIKAQILENDYSFPKTSKLKTIIIKNSQPNALCLPNGNIYITSALYKDLKDDEMLTFVIAHEMAHYKNKDHLRNIRHQIAAAVITGILIIANPNDNTAVKILSGGLDINNLNFSRAYEKRADVYAGKMLLKIYGNTDAGARVLNKLRDKSYPPILFLFSTHPDVDSRIMNLKNLRL